MTASWWQQLFCLTLHSAAESSSGGNGQLRRTRTRDTSAGASAVKEKNRDIGLATTSRDGTTLSSFANNSDDAQQEKQQAKREQRQCRDSPRESPASQGSASILPSLPPHLPLITELAPLTAQHSPSPSPTICCSPRELISDIENLFPIGAGGYSTVYGGRLHLLPPLTWPAHVCSACPNLSYLGLSCYDSSLSTCSLLLLLTSSCIRRPAILKAF